MNQYNRLQIANVVHLFHFIIIDVFMFSYLFVFNIQFDFYFIIIAFLQSMHWLVLKNECIITYIEKKLLDPNYKLGDNIAYNPYENIYYFNNKLLINIKTFIFFIIILYICYRNRKNKIVYLLIFAILVTIYINICKYNSIKKNIKKF